MKNVQKWKISKKKNKKMKNVQELKMSRNI